MASPFPAAQDGPPAQPGPSSAILVDNLSKRFGAFWALRGAWFSIRAGEVLGLIGPNGSGKTTLFECLGGVLPMDDGGIERGARRLTSSERAELLFYLPDAIAPWPAQRVGWLLDYVSGLFGGPVDRRAEVVHELGLDSLLEA